jgi:hypothetical protein
MQQRRCRRSAVVVSSAVRTGRRSWLRQLACDRRMPC